MTGALDTSAQFARLGIKTFVTTKLDFVSLPFDSELEVLAVDTGTRHLRPEEAALIIRQVVRQARKLKIPYFYKKTDSALRGNIGAELEAIWRETDVKQLPFIPAYPKNGRVTKNGRQYINEIPLHETEVGRDFFTPVTSSAIAEIIHLQSDAPVISTNSHEEPNDASGVNVYDALNSEDIDRIGTMLKDRGMLAVTAGCAGFAEVLPKLIDFDRTGMTEKRSCKQILIVSGSVNAHAIRQIAYAKERGMPVLTLSPFMPLGRDANAPLRNISEYAARTVGERGVLILSSIGQDELQSISMADRYMVMQDIGRIVKHILDSADVDALAVFGGDTLRGIIGELECDGIIPMAEPFAGVVHSDALIAGKQICIVSKAGDFGGPDIIERLIGYMRR